MNSMMLSKTAGATMTVVIVSVLFVSVLFFPVQVCAQSATGLEDRQDLTVIKRKVEEFLLMQSLGSPGKVIVTAGNIDTHVKLADCAAIETFLPAGSRAWGKTTVGVRCSSPSNWTIYVQAKVSVMSEYLVAAGPLAQGQMLNNQDMLFLKGDLATLPPGIFTDKSQVIGHTVSTSLPAGSVLRQEMLRSPMAVKQGQTVRLVSSGKGFIISADGTALTNASDGQVAQVKTVNGPVISGIARSGGQIEVNF